MSVLIVDDASIMRIVLKDILSRNLGFDKGKIREASGGKDAIAQYKKEKPEFVLCDISMPDMNVADVVKALKEIDQEAKVIMVTASGGQDKVMECISAGACDYIVKPPKPERIMKAINKIRGIEDEPEEDSENEGEAETGTEAESSTEPESPPEEKPLSEVEALRKELEALKKENEMLKAAKS